MFFKKTCTIEIARLNNLNNLASLDKISNLTYWNFEEYVNCYKNPNNKIYILKEKNKVIGSMVLLIISDYAEILQFVIDKKYQNMGYGTYFLKKIIKILQNLKVVEEVFLDVRENNDRAIHLYRKFGFNEIGKKPEYYKLPNKKIDSIQMVLGVY